MTERDISGNEDRAFGASMEPQTYALGLLNEECGEVVQLVGKALRFGIDTPNGVGPLAETARGMLHRELGDLFAAVSYGIQSGLLDGFMIDGFAKHKLAKLLNPESKDNLGRRLAPAPTAQSPSEYVSTSGPSFPQSSPEAGGDSITPSKER